MTSNKQRKRKVAESNRKQDDCTGVSVKKPANGAGRGYPKAIENTRMPHLEPKIQLQVTNVKVKLQLFPVDEQTRLGLEKDGHNPFLELTLSARKRISSVVRHLNDKWGSSSVVIGQIMLFPYNTKLEQLASCKRWTLNDSAITAWEVYVDVGSPSIFRLRYGCCSNLQQDIIPPKTSLLEAHAYAEGERRDCRVLEIPSPQEEKVDDETIKNQTNVNGEKFDVPAGFVVNEPTDAAPVHSSVPWDDNLTNLSIGGLLSEISMQAKNNGSDPNAVNKFGMQPIGLISDFSVGDLLSEASLLGKMSNPSTKLDKESSLQPFFLPSSDTSIGDLLSEASLLLNNKNKLDTQTIDAGNAQIQSQWDDVFTNLSMGALFSEASLQAKAGGGVELKESEPSAQINAHLPMPKTSSHEQNMSILDAEETCHAFPVRKFQTDRDTTTTSNARVGSSGCSKDTNSKQFQFSYGC